MCGIVGYLGNRKAQDVIYKGLSRLEYRGYDSAGIAALDRDHAGKSVTKIIKAPGKLAELKKIWGDIDFNSRQAIGHTRWATHGEANQANAHPHRSGPITIVHNGIIENHKDIREGLKSKGVKFSSETDSELFGHLVRAERDRGATLLESVRVSFAKIHGASAFVVMDEREPGHLVVVRNGSPLVIGLGQGENMVASDVPAILEYTRDIQYIEDNQLAEISESEVKLFSLSGDEVALSPVKIDWSLESAEKQGYPHYMLKEIFEQPRAINDSISAWIDSAAGKFRLEALASSKKGADKSSLTHAALTEAFTNAGLVHIVACGTAAHAGFFGQQLIERLAKVPARAELASEFRYREPVLRKNDVGIVVSQSGETADTLAAVKLMKQSGMKVFAICNVRDSSIPRECDGVFYTNAGLEIGVASTKAFTTQLALFGVIAAALASAKGQLSPEKEMAWVDSFCKLPKLMESVLERADDLKAIAEKYSGKKGFLFLGRGAYFPIALEGALKLKEIAYVHAEGYPSGELKHGPIAMVDPDMLLIAIAPDGTGMLHAKSLSNIEEVRARKGVVFSIGAPDDKQLREISDTFFEVPQLPAEELLPILSVVPLQLFAYHMAVTKGTEVDQPRNLAKSVTVE